MHVKDVWIMIADMIENSDALPNSSIADIGSAIGAFPSYLSTRFPDFSVFGFEYLDESVKKGREIFPEISLEQADILDESMWNKKYNLGVCGDWFNGPKVEDAWLSANDLAKKIK